MRSDRRTYLTPLSTGEPSCSKHSFPCLVLGVSWPSELWLLIDLPV